MAEALTAPWQQPVAYVNETGALTGNADGNKPAGRRGWQWVKLTTVTTVFLQGLNRSTAMAKELLGNDFGEIVVTDLFSAYNYLPLEQRQPCWAQLICDFTAIAQCPGACSEFGPELLELQKQFFAQWYRWKGGSERLSQVAAGLPGDPPLLSG
jgi:transposase